jgi:tricorn protease
MASPLIVGGRLVFVSDHEGTGNIYSSTLDGRQLRRHTGHDGFFARNPSTDGNRIVYHVAGDVWVLDDLDGEPHPVEVTLGSTAAARAPRLISAADHLGDLSCDQAGRASVVEVRGTVHWLAHQGGQARALSVDQAARARMPRMLGGTGKVVWVTDATGQDALAIAVSDGPGGHGEHPEAARVADGALGSVTDLAPAPDGGRVAVAARDGRVLVVDPASGDTRELARSGDGEVGGLAWSPDSAWLAWSEPGPRPLRRIRLARVAAGRVADVTDGRFADTEPVFTVDGRYLVFLSTRGLDSLSGARSPDAALPPANRPYLVPLAVATPSPFDPVPGGRSAEREADETPDTPRPPLSDVDINHMAARVVRVPVGVGRYSSLYAVTGGLAWLRSPVGTYGEGAADTGPGRPRPVLERFDLSSGACVELAAEADWFTVSGDGTRVIVDDHGAVRVQPSNRKPARGAAGDSVVVDLTRARFQADPAAMWRHAYAEAGRLMRRDFWTPDMSGLEWEAVLDAYRPLLERVRCPGDFADVLWEVFGELGTSHAFVAAPSPSGQAGPQGAATVGQLGADVSRDAAGRWRIDRVLPGDSSDPEGQRDHRHGVQRARHQAERELTAMPGAYHHSRAEDLLSLQRLSRMRAAGVEHVDPPVRADRPHEQYPDPPHLHRIGRQAG